MNQKPILVRMLTYKDLINKCTIKEQRSDEWNHIRRSLLTASDASNVLGRGLKSMRNVLWDKIFPPEKKVVEKGSSLWFGIEMEKYLKNAYVKKNGINVHETGLYLSEKYKDFGASPDGIRESDNGIIKGTQEEQFEIINKIHTSHHRG